MARPQRLSHLRFDHVLRPTGLGNQSRHRDSFTMPPGNPRSQNRLGIAASQSLQEVGVSRHTRNRRCVQHNSAANRHHRRKLPDDKAVSRQKQRRFRQLQPRKRLLALRDLLRPLQHNFRHSLHRVRVKMHPRAVFQRTRRRRQQAQPHVSPPCCLERRRRRQGHASRQVFCTRSR